MIKYENGYAIVDGYKFRKDFKTGYYLSGSIKGKRYRLHRYIYEKYKGKIPKGYEIHHIDKNKDNNTIENLQLLTSKKHKEIHSKNMTIEQRLYYKKLMNTIVRPKAITWHKSKVGREWHKEQYKISLGKSQNLRIRIICENCGKEFKTVNNGTNRFCSNNCKTAYRKKSGIDDETRKCIKCGRTYIVNKYSKRKYCYNCIAKKSRRNQCKYDVKIQKHIC